MAVPHTEAYRKNLDFIIKTVNMDDLLPKVFSSGCIELRHYEKIRRVLNNKGPSYAAEELFTESLIRNPDVRSFENVKKALIASNQRTLAELLQETYQQVTGRTGPSSVRSNQMISSTQMFGTEILNSSANSPLLQATINEQAYSATVTPHHGASSSVALDLESTQSTDSGMPMTAPSDQTSNAGIQQTAHPAASPIGQTADHVQQQGVSKSLTTDGTHMTDVARIEVGELDIDRNNQIGGGNFGRVFKWSWKGTDVAVKEIPVTFRKKTKEHDISVYSKEITISARLRHPNIVQLMAYAFGKESVFVVYELIDGYNLEHILFDEGRSKEYNLEWGDRLLIAQQMVKALRYLHESDPTVIHGDIKPANVMVSNRGLVTKICDLGMSRLKAKNAHTTTGGNRGAGTPVYMAPEQLLQGKSASIRSDVYAFGATLLELFTDSGVWDFPESPGESEMADIRNYVSQNMSPPALNELNNYDVKILIQDCLCRDEYNRPTALQIYEALHSDGVKHVETIQ